ncbi:MAG TPA: hypothetical protein VME70_16630 [Mycobacteriales bacterium]|nr:hypothetical protein [Mycobacteriales bacterium]
MFGRRKRKAAKLGPARRTAYEWSAVALPRPVPVTEVVAEPAAAPMTTVQAPVRSSVRLGFADGSSMDIDDASVVSDEIRATARRLLEASGSGQDR